MYKIREFINTITENKSFEEAKEQFNINGILVNEKEKLYLAKYDKSGTGFINNDIIKNFRGTIIEKITNDIVCMPVTGKTDIENFKKQVEWEDLVIEESIDGTMITLYYYNNTWHTSTKSTLEGNCSWKSENSTFSELFNEVMKDLNFDYSKLNRNFCYSFVLCHPKERNVTLYETPKLYHVLSRNLDTLRESDENLGIEKPKLLKLDNLNLLDVNNYQDLFQKLDTLEYTTEGYMLYSKNRLLRTKIKGKKHLYVKNLVGNQSNTVYRLLEIRLQEKLLCEYLKYYPEHLQLATDTESTIDNLAKAIHYFYSKVKKEKEEIEIPQIYRKPVYDLHKEYKELMGKYNPQFHKYKPNITLQKVIHYLNYEINTSYLFHLLKNLNSEE